MMSDFAQCVEDGRNRVVWTISPILPESEFWLIRNNMMLMAKSGSVAGPLGEINSAVETVKIRSVNGRPHH
jgi:hypothetical protein